MAPLDLTGRTATVEKVGDTDTRHVHIDQAPIPIAAQLFGDRSDNGRLLTSWDVDLWLNKKDDRLVKVEAASKAAYPYGREISSKIALAVSAFNDGDIADIKQPV